MELTLKRRFLVPMPGMGGAHRGGGIGLDGEAPFVDLGNDSFLFVLLRDKYYGRDLVSIINNEITRLDRDKEWSDSQYERQFFTLKKTNPTLILPSNYSPMLAVYPDVAKPGSFEEVSPEKLYRLRPSHAIRGMRVEVVGSNEPLSKDLAARFPAIAAGPRPSALYVHKERRN